MNNCPNCGNPIVNSSNFCKKCGIQLNQSTQTNTSETGHLSISRKKSFYGCAISLSVVINNSDYKMNSGDVLKFDLQPGRYIIAYKVWCRRQKEITIDVVAGGTYFVEFVNDYLWGGFKISKNSKLN